MQIERAINGVTTLGPGNRLAIWVNGCYRHCKGCLSERLQHFEPSNEQNIFTYFANYDLSKVDGITISGGEPFEQVEELLILVRYFKQRGINDILIYSGYTIQELHAKHDERIEQILNEIAVLIDGPYIDEQNNNTGNLKGSDNQRIIFINTAFKNRYDEYFRETRTMQEFRFGNYIVAVGIPTKEYIANFTKTN